VDSARPMLKLALIGLKPCPLSSAFVENVETPGADPWVGLVHAFTCRRSHPTLYFRISSALTSLLIPGSSGAGASPSIILIGPPASI
jgi:hypothetical protein